MILYHKLLFVYVGGRYQEVLQRTLQSQPAKQRIVFYLWGNKENPAKKTKDQTNIQNEQS